MQTSITPGRSLESVLPLSIEMAAAMCLSLVPPGTDVGAAQEAWSQESTLSTAQADWGDPES